MKSQTTILREWFEAYPNEWHALPDLVRIAGSFAIHSRVAELRSDHGMQIDNLQRNRDGKRQSCYRFMPAQPQAHL